MLSRESLAARLSSGASASFLFFWGHTPKQVGVVDGACLSQWFRCSFVVDGTTYATAEHFMMAEKARLFGDRNALAAILAAGTPSDAKALGRTVRGYDEPAWERARSEAVVRGNLGKFGQNPGLRTFLLGTAPHVLVEASPRDRIWGIGMGARNPDAREPTRWRGRNLLGFALMETRDRLVQP